MQITPPRCPNRDCPQHIEPAPRFYVRRGYCRPRCRRTPVPRPGDIVTAVEGVAIDGSAALHHRIGAIEPGTVVAISLLRDGKPMKVDATIGRRGGDVAAASAMTERFGFAVGDAERAPGGQNMRGEGGVVITSVAAGGPAAVAGLEVGTVIRAVGRGAVENLQDFEVAMSDLQNSNKIVMLVEDARGPRWVALLAD